MQLDDEENDYVDELMPIAQNYDHQCMHIKSAVSNCSDYNFEINYDDYQNKSVSLTMKNQMAKLIRKLQQQQMELVKVYGKARDIQYQIQQIYGDMKLIFEKQQTQYKYVMRMKRTQGGGSKNNGVTDSPA